MPVILRKINHFFISILTFISSFLTYYLGLGLSYLISHTFHLFRMSPKPQSNWHPLKKDHDLHRMY